MAIVRRIRGIRGTERWPSGLRRSLGKRVYGKPYRGFESLPLRQSLSPHISFGTNSAGLAQHLANSLVEHGFTLRAQIIWAKERLVMSRGDYHWKHEPAWYAVRTKGNWTGDRKQTTVWEIASGGQDAETSHATQKPAECMRRPMLNNSEPGEAVYDPFLGSGTTLIAAQTTGRICIGMELDPRHVDVAVRRWQAFTGVAACLLGDGRSFDVIALERRAEPKNSTPDSTLPQP